MCRGLHKLGTSCGKTKISSASNLSSWTDSSFFEMVCLSSIYFGWSCRCPSFHVHILYGSGKCYPHIFPAPCMHDVLQAKGLHLSSQSMSFFGPGFDSQTHRISRPIESLVYINMQCCLTGRVPASTVHVDGCWTLSTFYEITKCSNRPRTESDLSLHLQRAFCGRFL